jgi:hypothetical protein
MKWRVIERREMREEREKKRENAKLLFYIANNDFA